MNRTARIASYLVAAAIGAASVVFLPRIFLASKASTAWVEASWPGVQQGITYTEAVFARSDLPTPEIDSLTAKVKFLEQPELQTTEVGFGYATAIVVGTADLSKVPKKYLVEKPVTVAGKTMTQLPITHVNHEVLLVFSLYDRDGFKLTEVLSKPHVIESGKTNSYQEIADAKVPVSIAARTANVSVRMSIEKCTLCEN